MSRSPNPTRSRVFVGSQTSTRTHARPDRSAGPDATTTPSVAETIDTFLAAVDDRSARDRTGRLYSRAAARELHWFLAGHAADAFGARRLDDVHRADVDALLDELGAAGLSRRRLDDLARSVRALYDHARERGLVRHNPAERIAMAAGHEDDQPGATGRDAAPSRHRTLTLALRLATAGVPLSALVLLAVSP